MKITRFRNQYRFLSNFYPARIFHRGLWFPSVEHAYQSAKAFYDEDRIAIQQAKTAGEAKRMGRRIRLPGWDQNSKGKIELMLNLVRQKFVNNSALGEQLLSTGDAELVEGNEWGDRFWGECRGEGENHLGKILMKVRRELQQRRAR